MEKEERPFYREKKVAIALISLLIFLSFIPSLKSIGLGTAVNTIMVTPGETTEVPYYIANLAGENGTVSLEVEGQGKDWIILPFEETVVHEENELLSLPLKIFFPTEEEYNYSAEETALVLTSYGEEDQISVITKRRMILPFNFSRVLAVNASLENITLQNKTAEVEKNETYTQEEVVQKREKEVLEVIPVKEVVKESAFFANIWTYLLLLLLILLLIITAVNVRSTYEYEIQSAIQEGEQKLVYSLMECRHFLSSVFLKPEYALKEFWIRFFYRMDLTQQKLKLKEFIGVHFYRGSILTQQEFWKLGEKKDRLFIMISEIYWVFYCRWYEMLARMMYTIFLMYHLKKEELRWISLGIKK